MIKLENLDGGHVLFNKHEIICVTPHLVPHIKIAAQYRPVKSRSFFGSDYTTYERISQDTYEHTVNGSIVHIYHSMSCDRHSFVVKETVEEIQKLLK